MIIQNWKSKSIENIIKKAKKMYLKKPNSTLFFPLADAYRKADMFDEAESLLRQGLSSYPKYWAAKALLGEILYNRGDMRQAQQELEAVVLMVPENMMARNLLLKIYKKIGFNQAPEKQLRILRILEEPLNLESYSSYEAQTLEDETQTAKEQESTCEFEENTHGNGQQSENLIQEQSGKEIITATLAELYFSQGLQDKAVKIYQKLLLQEPDRNDWAQRLREIQGFQEKKTRNIKTKLSPDQNMSKRKLRKKVLQELNKWCKNCQHMKKLRRL